MTSPGGIQINVQADASGFDEELRRAVTAAIRDVQRELNQNPLEISVKAVASTRGLASDMRRQLRELSRTAGFQVQVGAQFRTTGLRGDVQRQLRELSNTAGFQVRVGGQFTTSGMRADVRRQLRELSEASSFRVGVGGQFTTSGMRGDIRRQLRELSDAGQFRVRVGAEFNPAGLRAAIREQLRALSESGNLRVRVGAEFDPTGMRSQLRTRLRELDGERVRVGVDVDRSSLDGLRSALGGIDGTRIAGVTAAVAAIGGAAGAAAGAVGGLALGAAALGPAFAAAAGTATVALSGIKDAFDAVEAASEAAPGEAAAQAKAVASAQNQLTSALEGVDSAQRSLSEAQKDAKDAQDDLADAYKDAGDDLEDLQFKLRGSVLDQKEAAIALKEAQKDYAEAFFDPDKREKAFVRLQRAQLNYDKSVAEGRDTAEEFAEAQEKGIEGSDRVVAAKERAADADQRVMDAQRQVAQANRQVAQAQQALTEAQNQGSASAQKLEQALAKLAPSAREFVVTAQELGPVWEEVRKSVQEAAFDGLAEDLRGLATNVLPTLKDGMVGVAGELNAGARGFAAWLQSANGVAGLEATFQNTQLLLKGMREGSEGFLDSLSALAVGAQPFMENLGRAFGSIGTALGDSLSQMAESGLFQEVLVGLTTALQGVGPLLGDMLTAFAELANRVLPALQPLFIALGDALVAIAPALGDLGRIFADSLTAIMPTLSAFIRDLAVGLQPVLPVIANLLTAIGNALRPMIGPLSQAAVVIGTALADAVNALAPAMGPLAQAFADLVVAVSPLIPLLADSFSVVLQALAPAISQIAVALAPVIAQFAEQMKPVLEQLAPILAETAMILGTAIADAIKQVAPVLPQLVTAFTDLVLAVVPLLPEFAKLAAEILPPLVRIWVEMTPVTIKLIEALTWLVQQVLPIVIEHWRIMGDTLSTVFTVIGDAVVFWKTVFKEAFDEVKGFWDDLQTKFDGVKAWFTDTLVPAFGTAIDKVKGFFQTGVDGIKTAWHGLQEAAAVPVRFVVNTVWNEGLLKAWNAVARFLPGIEPMEKVTLGFATGGAVRGPGSGTSDSIPAWLSNGEHVVTAAEVMRAGGQNIWYAIRDMIARGIPFRWDNGRVISELGRDNLAAYGAAVREKGIGNVSPEGLFDQLLPRFQSGGAVEVLPWMRQLLRGHEFAKSQHGRHYQWGGPRFVGDSFDCSGFMGSIAAAILGMNPWKRYWATGSFGRGQRASGPQGFVAGVDNGFSIGVTDDPGGPGGGHTAGTLGAIPALGIRSPVNVESGGALGNVHYGGGPDPRSFLTQYHLPIGANGFFQPGTGGGTVGPSPDEQRGFIERRIGDIFRQTTGPIRDSILSVIGAPPPEFRRLPGAFLTWAEGKAVSFLASKIPGLGDLLPGAWEGAQRVIEGIGDTASRALDALNPFDSGGIANGTGFMPKNVIAPERVLSPEQTKLFEALVLALQQIAGAGGQFAVSAVDAIGSNIANAVGETLRALIPPAAERPEREAPDTGFMLAQQVTIDEQGRILADTRDMLQRSESDRNRVIVEQFEQLKQQVSEVAGRLSGGVLIPIVESGMDAALKVVKDLLGAGFADVEAGTDRTTAAVENLDTGVDPGGAPVPPLGAPGSAFDAAAAFSEAVTTVANTAAQVFQQVAQDIANAALEQRPSRVDNSRGVLGRDISGGPLVDLIVRLTGVEIEVLDTLQNTLEEIREMRGDQVGAFDSAGRIVADTAELMQRNESSRELVLNEMNRLNKELMKAVMRYLVLSVLLPILTAVLGAMIQLAVTAIGAAIGSIIPGIGTVIGAAIGAVVGAALAGAAAVFTGLLAVGAGAAIDSFDSGGVASGIGFMPKNTIEPERVLSPRQTESFDRLVAALEGQRGNRTVNAPITVLGGSGAAPEIQNRLLSLL
ncbi:phage tail protein [Nocardia cyriacigeorgica]|uniref:phage tail protein n=1 Tax=Nocardia cyriacigeorgica TaxID=135487 RepID=UPI002454D216|nr:hypothetical protein [Nocardia cyriacigeorgica]